MIALRLWGGRLPWLMVALGVAGLGGSAGFGQSMPAGGTLGYGPPGIRPGFQGFGLGYHLGFGFGGDALGPGAEGGYPFYGGPGYPHPAPELYRGCGITPFAYYGGNGCASPGHPNFFGGVAPLVPDQPVMKMEGEGPGAGGATDYGSFNGSLPYPESAFAPDVAGADLNINGPGPMPSPADPTPAPNLPRRVDRISRTAFQSPGTKPQPAPAQGRPPAPALIPAPAPAPRPRSDSVERTSMTVTAMIAESERRTVAPPRPAPLPGGALGIDAVAVIGDHGMTGLKIARIYPGGAAEAANLRPEDVIYSINGYRTDRPDRLAWVAQNAAPDGVLKISARTAVDGRKQVIEARVR